MHTNTAGAPKRPRTDLTMLDDQLADRHLMTLQESEVYRPLHLHALTLVHADERGVWHPPTTRSLLQALARRGQRECTSSELENAIKQAVAQGLLSECSTVKRLVLSGASRHAEQDDNNDNTNPKGDA